MPPAQDIPDAIGLFPMSLLGLLIGILSGLGAVVFRGMIALFHNLFFLGHLSLVYDTTQHTPASPWGAGIILVPALVGLGVAFVVKTFAPSVKGTGVPEVLEAIYYRDGIIPASTALFKSVASALSIGSGASVGREGPIMQIGATLGATLGRWIEMPAWERIGLIAAGAAGGIAATFNTPVGGILFTVEVVMSRVTARTLVPVTIASAAGAAIGRIVYGNGPSFTIPSLGATYLDVGRPDVLLSFVGLGLLMGLASTLFIKAVYGFEDFFDGRIGGSLYRRQFLGMLCAGILIYLTFISLGNYSIQGVGYATIQTLLTGAKMSLLVLAALAGLKLIVTSLALGSGASGGIFSPALFLGATLGVGYGTLLGQVVPFFSTSAPEFALAGMAGVVGGSTGAVLAAITMLFEMTLDYRVIIPMTITVAISYGVRYMLSVESIYTLKNSRRGQTMPHGLHTNFHFQRRAGDIMSEGFSRFAAKLHADEAMALVTLGDDENVLLIEANGAIVGVLKQAQLAQALALGKHDASLSDLADPKFLRVDPATKLNELLATMRDDATWVALVRGPVRSDNVESVAGVITRKETTNAIVENIELMAD